MGLLGRGRERDVGANALSSMEIKVSLITAEIDFLKLEERWNELLEQSGSRSIFLTWEWIEAWWKNYKQDGDRLFVLLAEDSSGLIGIAPLYSRKVRFLQLVNIKALFFLGDGSWDSDYLDFIIASGRERWVLDEFCHYLSNIPGWSLALLNGIPETSRNLQHLARCSEEFRFLLSKRDMACAYTPLPDHWQSYLAKLRPRFRTKVRSSLKNLENGSEAKFECCNDEAALESVLQRFFDLHARRWALKYEQGVFDFPGKRGFYLDMAKALLRKNRLRLFTLMLGKRIVACQLGLEYHNALYHLQEGFDPEYEDLSVGIALRAHVFRECIANHLSEYDFLGGMGRHKTDWGAVPKSSALLVLGKQTPLSWLYLSLPPFLEGCKQTIKNIIPHRVLELRRRWRIRSNRKRFEASRKRKRLIGRMAR